MDFTLESCSTQSKIDPNFSNDLIEKRAFIFHATKALPMSAEVINAIHSIPHSTSARILDLDYGYGITFKEGEMISTLPYFGRAFSSTINRDKEGLSFTSKDYPITQKTGKENSTILHIRPKDVDHIQNITLEIFPNGRAYLSIEPNDRQPISYQG